MEPKEVSQEAFHQQKPDIEENIIEKQQGMNSYEIFMMNEITIIIIIRKVKIDLRKIDRVNQISMNIKNRNWDEDIVCKKAIIWRGF